MPTGARQGRWRRPAMPNPTTPAPIELEAGALLLAHLLGESWADLTDVRRFELRQMVSLLFMLQSRDDARRMAGCAYYMRYGAGPAL